MQDRYHQREYVTIGGGDSIELRMAKVILISYTLDMSVEEFYANQAVATYLATFFNLPASKVNIQILIGLHDQSWVRYCR